MGRNFSPCPQGGYRTDYMLTISLRDVVPIGCRGPPPAPASGGYRANYILITALEVHVRRHPRGHDPLDRRYNTPQ
jgi:hypothetical protein